MVLPTECRRRTCRSYMRRAFLKAIDTFPNINEGIRVASVQESEDQSGLVPNRLHGVRPQRSVVNVVAEPFQVRAGHSNARSLPTAGQSLPERSELRKILRCSNESSEG